MNKRKVDIYLYNLSHGCWQYECSTTWAKSCKHAKARFIERHGLHPDQVKARFAEARGAK